MELLQNFGVNIALCVVGLLGYTLFVVRKHLKTFKWRIFWNDNKPFWIWAILVQTLYAGLMAAYPSLELWLSSKLVAILTTTLGFDLAVPEDLVNTIIYLTLTWQLSRYTNKAVNEEGQIGTSKTVNPDKPTYPKDKD
ncbi:hypothetical protein Phi10:1_gp096 [Cellulophaga phage phi10:1]|uniref:Uncharacterized protein n=2 Tax=Assiduviridae TaxID=2946156 RepID=R9ZZ98_9CAUD|nr:hypothetical protein Phi10:1_gp096 [Cellulophaga phage phi10:1]YP_010357498.1 hypothetical protein M1M31_gp56 [Cellulophaga phage Nekkels_1]AGO48436.1 hypothetical protein Phi10:1_gp096 [Cellulophaga phage phi10:1]QQO97059.1 hypothetical protein Nekkels1_56 [Cellulophaga phage Nekkels_1]QQO97152.1 hypothetical protein Nekkels2_56 [Cellulophaga phage Nekkels_2]